LFIIFLTVYFAVL